MSTIALYVKLATQKLSAMTDSPLLEAELLLSHVLQVSRSYLHAYPEKEITTEAAALFVSYLLRRIQLEPIAYITGVKSFWDFELQVSRNTLIPRPETEQLVETVLSLFPDRASTLRVLDLGTGSGAIALALGFERPLWEIIALDLSVDALQIARANATQLNIQNVSFREDSWHSLKLKDEFDLIVSNPPYLSCAEWGIYKQGLAFEPYEALVSGQDGLEAIRAISSVAFLALKQGGYLVLEHGFKQSAIVYQLLAQTGYSEVIAIKDLLGYDRITVGRVLSYS
ncbi:MAG: protein-(glutamine-N5) methyltransferase, release factor-specific [Gammaproteobacteria bacterium RIFCSPHIGHO2_12_FULL_42_10]|nr:MAG: protein-(glutamine-N5) methyltransferase, release factor-specific [Gammaproteobacteria bacterium RIFCSPHIGHO2_12_FULL_42_10]